LPARSDTRWSRRPRHSRDARGRFPHQRNAVRRRFVTAHTRPTQSRAHTASKSRNGSVLIDCLSLIACRLPSIDYSRVCPVGPVGPSWELDN
jgi:hypothetical protein